MPEIFLKHFKANVVQNLLNEGILDRGIIAVGNAESIEKVSRPHDELNILMTLKSDGTMEKTVVGSVVESCILDAENIPESERLKEIFVKDSLQMISFTITEKAYSLVDAAGEFLPAVAEDLENGPEKPKSYMGKIAALFKGNKMELSPDPLLESLQPYFATIKLGDVDFVEAKLKPLLESETIFGVNLY